MTKTKSTKRALLLSALSLLMCVSMLIGSTFAWFSDSVTSGNNKIVAGTLDIDLYKVDLKDNWFEEFRAGNDIFNNEEITDSEEAIFSEDILWEPGYTEVANLKLVNNGNLALKYQAVIRPTGTVGMLAEVIDVYVANEVITPMGGTREDQIQNNMTKVGTLKEVMEGAAIINGEMKTAGDTQFFSIVLKMQESAGNKYQGQTAGAFDITVLANQLAYESDSFGNDYDANANVFNVTNAAEAQAALDAAEDGAIINLAAGNYGTLYIRQSDVSTNIDKNYATAASDEVKLRVIKNLTIKSESGAIVDAIVAEAGVYHNTEHSNSAEYPILDSYIVLDNVRIEGITFTGTANAITLNDRVSVDGLTIEGCEMKRNDSHLNQHHFLEINPNGAALAFTDNNGDTFFTRNRAEVTVNNCKADYVKRFILMYNSENLTVTNNYVTNVAQSFVNPQADSMMARPQHIGTMTFTGNTVTNCTDTFLSAAFVDDLTIVLDSNNINNPFFNNDANDGYLVSLYKSAGTDVTVINRNNIVSGSATVNTIEVSVE